MVADVSNWSMPVILAVAPHDQNSSYFLPSWPDPWTTSGHFIAIPGYSGSWSGTDTGATVFYVESSGDGGMGPGRYSVGGLTAWKVNNRNGSKIVW